MAASIHFDGPEVFIPIQSFDDLPADFDEFLMQMTHAAAQLPPEAKIHSLHSLQHACLLKSPEGGLHVLSEVLPVDRFSLTGSWTFFSSLSLPQRMATCQILPAACATIALLQHFYRPPTATFNKF